jgi:uncharacterized protein
MMVDGFETYGELARVLLPWNDAAGDGSHDGSHLARVWRNARAMQREEGGDLELLAAAVLLHDCVHVPKDSPLRAEASRLAAEKARVALAGLGWEAARVEAVAEAIESHSFSAEMKRAEMARAGGEPGELKRGGLEPEGLEARILQDADRLDALGLTGVARCFYTAGRMGSELYDGDDPRGEARELDDRRFALDHFPKKLLRLAEGFRTETGRRMARARHEALVGFYEGMLGEIG